MKRKIAVLVSAIFLVGCGLVPTYAPVDNEDYLTYESYLDYNNYLVCEDDLIYLEEVEAEPKPTATPIPSPEIGNIIEFGGHNWLVLDVEDGKALIITERIIDIREYHDTNGSTAPVTWEDSTIRCWLNNDFYSSFTVAESGLIVETLVVNNGNLQYGTWGGADTNDKVFLLSIEEVEKYFGSDISARIALSAYGDESTWWMQPIGYWRNYYGQPRSPGDTTAWWLRSPGNENKFAARVFGNGSIETRGYFVNFRYTGVRPALWLNLLYE